MGNGTNCNGTTTYTGTANLSIPDGDGSANAATHSVGVPDSFTVGDVMDQLNITHAWVGDVVVTVRHGTTKVTVMDVLTGGNVGGTVEVTFSEAMGAGVSTARSTASPGRARAPWSTTSSRWCRFTLPGSSFQEQQRSGRARIAGPTRRLHFLSRTT
ncbi:MAG: hypothetical protein HOP29_17285 [Phycisphaerales bacterium]|nr:hypothetical protein [Phycisphaerales bacterium]